MSGLEQFVLAAPAAQSSHCRPNTASDLTAMDEYQRAKFIRGMAHECRMHAALAKYPERRLRWLELAQDYERQADQLDAMEATNTIGPASVLPFRRVGSR